MEDKNFNLIGVIQGKNDPKTIMTKMDKTVNLIKNQISKKYSNNKNFYIYYRYNSTKFVFNIFVKVLKNTNMAFTKKDITYLIVIYKDYPIIPPYVFCLTSFSEKIDIFDMRNIQKNLIREWKDKYTINDLIHELENFSDTLIFQAEKKLMPNIGEYIYNTYYYDLNDFFLNTDNIFFRVYYLSNDERKSEIFNNEKYMIITKNNIIFLACKDQYYKNCCIVEFDFDLTCINSLNNFPVNENPDYTFFKFEWNNHSSYLNDFVFGIKKNINNIHKIKDLLLDRRRFLLNNFKYYEKYHDNDVNVLEKIISIKEEYLNKSFSRGLFYQVQKLYRKIINIYNSMNDDGYKIYYDKMKQFLDKYK